VKTYEEGKGVELSVLGSGIAEYDVTCDLEVLNVTRPAVDIGLTIGRLE
jgi:hypothetical protein